MNSVTLGLKRAKEVNLVCNYEYNKEELFVRYYLEDNGEKIELELVSIKPAYKDDEEIKKVMNKKKNEIFKFFHKNFLNLIKGKPEYPLDTITNDFLESFVLSSGYRIPKFFLVNVPINGLLSHKLSKFNAVFKTKDTSSSEDYHVFSGLLLREINGGHNKELVFNSDFYLLTTTMVAINKAK